VGWWCRKRLTQEAVVGQKMMKGTTESRNYNFNEHRSADDQHWQWKKRKCKKNLNNNQPANA